MLMQREQEVDFMYLLHCDDIADECDCHMEFYTLE